MTGVFIDGRRFLRPRGQKQLLQIQFGFWRQTAHEKSTFGFYGLVGNRTSP
jgi:hypothetical protein